MVNDWTLIESAYVIIAVCAIPVLVAVIIGIWEVIKWAWRAMRKELKYRYIFREVRHPEKYRKMRRNAKEPMWDVLRWVFDIRK